MDRSFSSSDDFVSWETGEDILGKRAFVGPYDIRVKSKIIMICHYNAKL